jgi:hypothetical protein
MTTGNDRQIALCLSPARAGIISRLAVAAALSDVAPAIPNDN